MMTKKFFAMLSLFTAFIAGSCTKERTINAPGNLVPRTVDQDASLPSAMINGALLHTEAYGPPDSTLIICIHGGPGSDYRSILRCKELAARGYRVVFYDQRGTGLSQRFPKQYYLDNGKNMLIILRDELKQIIAYYRTREDQKVVLLGHPWGATLATYYASEYPKAVQGMILCEPGGLNWNDMMEYTKKSRDFSLMSESLNDITYQDQFITGKEDDQQILDYKMALQASKNEVTGEDETLPESSWRHGAVQLNGLFEIGKKYEPDFSEGIENFTKPVLFIYSEKNLAYPDSWAQKISSAYKNVTLLKIKGTGHDGIILDQNAWENQTMPAAEKYLNSIK